MLRIFSHHFIKKATVLNNVSIEPTPLEHKIFDFIRNSIKDMPNQPVVRIGGGWVRDKLLNEESDDIDITVDNMSGKDFVTALNEIAIQRYGNQSPLKILNVDFETNDEQVKQIAAGQISIFGQQIDVVSLRKESWVHPETGEKLLRNPIVTEGTVEDDAFRRDLTINCLFYRINDGAIEDFTGGYSDLATMTLRPPVQKPDHFDESQWNSLSPEKKQYYSSLEIFTQDPIRLVRVLRFYSRYPNSTIYGMSPNNNGPVIEAMKDPTVQQLLTNKLRDPTSKGIVAEKNTKEFRKMMGGNRPAESLTIMYQTGLLDNMLNLPDDFSNLGMDQNNKWHEQTVIAHILSVVKNTNTIATQMKLPNKERGMLNMAALFHDIGKLDPRAQKTKPDGSMGFYGNPNHPERMTHEESSRKAWQNFAQMIKLSNSERKFGEEVIIQHMKPHDLVDNKSPRSALGKFKDRNPGWKFIYIHAMADAMSKETTPDWSRSEPYKEQMDIIEDITLPPKFKGDDIMNMTGMKPGKDIGRIIAAIREQQYENLNLPQPLSPEEERQQAINIIFTYKNEGKLVVPELADRQRIQQLVQEQSGIVPGRPPVGHPGFTQLIRERLQQERITNPQMTPADAEQIIKNMIDAGELDPYRV